MTTIAAALAAFFKALEQVMGWFSTQRLRRLGQLEVRNEQLKDSIEDRAKADAIDAQPDATDPDELLRRLQNKRSN